MKPNTPEERAAVVMAAAQGRQLRVRGIRPDSLELAQDVARIDATHGRFNFNLYHYEVIEPRLVVQNADMPSILSDGVPFLCFKDCERSYVIAVRTLVLDFSSEEGLKQAQRAISELRTLAQHVTKGGRS